MASVITIKIAIIIICSFLKIITLLSGVVVEQQLSLSNQMTRYNFSTCKHFYYLHFFFKDLSWVFRIKCLWITHIHNVFIISIIRYTDWYTVFTCRFQKTHNTLHWVFPKTKGSMRNNQKWTPLTVCTLLWNTRKEENSSTTNAKMYDTLCFFPLSVCYCFAFLF